MRISADVALANAQPRGLDTVIAGGGMNIREVMTDARLLDGLRVLSAGARRTCSVCTGAFLLGEAGLLSGRRATTHWAFCAELAQRYPEIRVEPDRIFVRDGSTTTSAGVSAGIDLALALVQDDHGAEVARTVARWLVVFLQRPGGQSQFSERLSLPVTVGAQIRAVLDRDRRRSGGRPPPGPARTTRCALRAPPAAPVRGADEDDARTLRRARARRDGARAARGQPSSRSRPWPHSAALAAPRRCAAHSCASSASDRPSTASASGTPSTSP